MVASVFRNGGNWPFTLSTMTQSMRDRYPGSIHYNIGFAKKKSTASASKIDYPCSSAILLAKGKMEALFFMMTFMVRTKSWLKNILWANRTISSSSDPMSFDSGFFRNRKKVEVLGKKNTSL
jgi:hypothetical protein